MNQAMESGSAVGGEPAERIARALEAIREAASGALAAAGGEELLALLRAVDQVERVGHGLLLTVLARVDEAKAAGGGVGPWLTAQLGYQPGRARGLAQDARRIGSLPELAEQLSTGQLQPGATRVLSRAAHAVRGTMQESAQAVTETLAILAEHGTQRAEEHVRTLEHTVDPGHAKDLQSRQRARSFARISELPDGRMRFDVLLDTERATTLRTALDMQVSTWLRSRQFDQHDLVPEDVSTTEQLTAQAFTRLAEIFLNATEQQRNDPHTPTVVYYAPATTTPITAPVQDPASSSSSPKIPTGCAQTAYGALVPLRGLPSMQDPAALHLILHPTTGHPLTLNGQPIDQDPAARLASPAQRLALAYRDRHCIHPGCTRPAPWSLHAHHLIPHSQHGPTTLPNLALFCPEHHTLAHRIHILAV